MKRKITFLLAAFLLMFSYAGLAQVESGTTYSTPSVSGLPEGWSGNDGDGTNYVKLIDATHYIQTAEFEQNGFTSITIKARKFGGPSDAQAKITVSWYDSEEEETVLGTIDPTSTTLTNYTISNPATTESGTGYIKIQNKDASSNKGSGISEVTITYVEPGGTPPTYYTVTYNANVTGIEPVVDTYAEGTNVTLRGEDTFTNEGFTFEEWNTDANGDGDAYSAGDVIEGIDDNIELYAIWTESTTPGGDEQWILTNLADLTESDVFVIVGNNGSNYAMSNNNGTSSAPTAVAVTVENDAITSTVAANIQWNISGNATNGYTFYPNGSTTTWLYCNTDASSSSNNNMRVGTGNRKVFELNSNNYLLTKDDKTTRYLSIYNNQDWRGYTNTNLCPEISFYKKVTGGVVPPSISAENIEITYDATNGLIEYTINNEPDPVGTLTASTESDWLTLGTVGETIPFTCTANDAAAERTATVILTYTYDDNQTVTKEVTVTQAGNPNIVDNISDITQVGAIYNVKGMVVATNNRGFIICDGTGLVYTYLNAVPTQQLGDFVRISGTTGSYGHVIQFTSSATINVAEAFDFNWPEYSVITEIPNYTEGNHLSDYFQFEGNLTKSDNNYLVAVGEGQIRISYPTESQSADLETLLNKTVRIHGFFTGYSGTGNNAVFTAMMESYEEIPAPVEPSITFDPATVDITAEMNVLQIPFTYENIEVTDYESFTVHHYDATGEEIQLVQESTWCIVGVTGTNAEGYQVSGVASANEGEARSAYIKVSALDAAGNTVYSNLLTINQEAYVAPFEGATYTLAASIEPGKHYIIVGEKTVGDETSYYAMGQPTNNNRTAVEVTVDEGVAQVESDDVYEFVISGPDASGLYTIYDATTPGYLYAASSSSNYLRTRASNSDGNSQWTITFEEYNAVITAQGDYTRNLMRYNSSSNLFSCYGSGQQPVYLYVKNEDKDYNFYSNTILVEVTIADDETYTVHNSATLDVTTTLTNEGAAANLIIKDGAQLKTPNAVHGTIQKNIVGYGANNENTNLGYYLLKSPVPGMMNLTLAIESGMVNGTVDNPDFTGIDFYQFNSQKKEEWQNVRIDEYFASMGIPANTGYLYANVNDVTLSFATFEEEEQGQMNQHLFNATTTDVSTLALRYGNTNPFDGWSLIGNPYTCNAYLLTGRDFYRTNSTGDAIVLATENVIKPCESIFVVVDEHDPETWQSLPTGEVLAHVYFTTTAPQRTEALMDVTVSRSGEMLDAARVRFNNGCMLNKMVLNGNATRLSISQDSNEYSVVRSEGQDEMPVSFKASENGTYTLSVNPENVEFGYLHLFDNMTGTDVDLLQTPSYTFNACTSDYASRFRLVFKANNIDENIDSTDSASFAFFNGNEWVVSNTGEATLQVVDMMGRVLSSETVNGNATMNINQTPGVYMFRLINGDSVKVQKVVVR